MPKRLLDSNVLINHYRAYPRGRARTPETMRKWAEALVGLRGTRFIATPVYIEVVGGAQSPLDLRMVQAFLTAFHIIDERTT
jgi:hypothetical protein